MDSNGPCPLSQQPVTEEKQDMLIFYHFLLYEKRLFQ